MHLIWISVCLSLQVFAHPYFISICQIHHNSNAQSIEIGIKVFTDDLENAIVSEGSEALYLGTDQEIEDADKLVAEYISRHLQLVVNGKSTKGTFLGKESEADVLWCYIEVLDIPTVHKMEVTNDMLMHQFDTQINIVHITVAGDRKSMLLQKGRSRDQVDFD